MKRTQIYLPEKQHDHLKRLAIRRRSSVSDVIRKLVENEMAENTARPDTKQSKSGEWLLEQARWAENKHIAGPSDLSTKLDDYLYG
ncbi:MAG TPA: CopG family transcriptional regulator [Candidatus Saccharimonadales bacterium]|jgi:metal-responsive CopG/Arc/MetJ family transcriptional regulator